MSSKTTGQEKRILEQLRAKQRDDPEGFRKYLPGVEELLPPLQQSSKSRSPFGLTERERVCHEDGLAAALAALRQRAIGRDEALRALQHCAELIRDDNLPDAVDHETMKSLLAAAIGKSPGSIKAKTTIPLVDDPNAPILETVSAIRGVYLNLGKGHRLVSIGVNPTKVKEFREMMKIIGIVGGVDTATDVAARHDDYLAAQDPHAGP